MRYWISILFIVVFTSITYAQDAPSEDEIKQVILAESPMTVIGTFENESGFEAIIESYGCVSIDNTEYGLELLTVRNSQIDQTIWRTEQLISCSGLDTYGFQFVRWVGDVLYFDSGREGSPHGASFAFIVEPLFRNTGEAEQLGSALFSHLGDYLVTWDTSGIITITTADMMERQSITLDIPDLAIANVIWLPDQRGVIIIQIDDIMLPQDSLVTYIDRERMTQTALLNPQN
ncbi:MAG: hypothetical protein AAF846_02560 [Chloroflexota bacterium]